VLEFGLSLNTAVLTQTFNLTLMGLPLIYRHIDHWHCSVYYRAASILQP
jgi:hypothetical protein